MTSNRRAVARVLELVQLALTAEERGRITPTAAIGHPVEAPELVRAASRHRVLELLHTHGEELALADQYGTPLVEALAVHHADIRRHVAMQILEISRVISLFDAAGVPVLTFKGPALAMQSTGDVTARGPGDIDLFVGSESVEPALILLRRNGWKPREGASAEPGTWAWRHLLGVHYEITLDGPASTVDLHWRLDPNPHVLPDFRQAWDRRTLIDLGVGPVPCLDVETAFLHACQHAAKDDWRWLRSLVDVRRLARLPEVRDLVATGLPSPGGHVTATLAVTGRLVGLPSGVQAPPARARHLRRASRSQSRDALPDRPLPTAQGVRNLRYRLVASRTPRDLLDAFSAAAAPVHSLDDLDDRTGWTAVPKLTVRRARRLVAQCLRWAAGRRRTAVAPGSDGIVVLQGSDR